MPNIVLLIFLSIYTDPFVILKLCIHLNAWVRMPRFVGEIFVNCDRLS